MQSTSAVSPLARATGLDRIGQFGLVLGRIIIGYLWYTQLLWKMPPQFGCPANFAISTSITHRTSGLCDWGGLMAIYSKLPIHAAFVKDVFLPNIRIFGWGVWLLEAFVCVSLVLGLFSRLGAFAGLLQAVNLYIGLTAIPGEWYWSYGMLITLQLIFFFLPPGRTLGVDTLLRKSLIPQAEKGNRLAQTLLWLT